MIGNYRIEFEGLNFARLLNDLSKYGVANVTKSGRYCAVSVKYKFVNDVVELLKRNGCNVTSANPTGIASALDFIRSHFLFFLLLTVGVACLFVTSCFCLKITVVGDFDEKVVVDALTDCNISRGKALTNLNVDSVENNLANKLDAAYAIITRSGCALTVKVIAKKTIESPIDLSVRRDIVSDVCGIVQSISCEQGKACVKVGDSVGAGDILIQGIRLFDDELHEEVYAMGSVVVITKSNAFVVFDGYRKEQVRTGRMFSANYVNLFGKRYGKACPFSHFDESITDSYLYPLNLRISKITYHETCESVVPCTIEDCLPQLQQEALSLAVADFHFPITTVEYVVKTNGVEAIVYGTVEYR